MPEEKQQVWFTPVHAYPLPETLGSWWLIPLTPLYLPLLLRPPPTHLLPSLLQFTS